MVRVVLGLAKDLVGRWASLRLSPLVVIVPVLAASAPPWFIFLVTFVVSVTCWFFREEGVNLLPNPQPGGPVSLMTEFSLRPQPGGPVSLMTESPLRTVLVRGKPLLYEEDIHPIDQPGDAPTTPYSPSAGGTNRK